MSVASLLCDEIYSTFLIIKDALDTLVNTLGSSFNLLYKIVSATMLTIKNTVYSFLDYVTSLYTELTSSLLSALGDQISSTNWCKKAFKCDILIDMILDEDSLIGKMISKVYNDDDDCYCKDSNTLQQTLYNIANDYRSFKQQICTGLTVDYSIGIIKSLATDIRAQLNKWLKKCKSKLNAIKRRLQSTLDDITSSSLFDYLELLESFFECIIDNDACANVETAKSYYTYVVNKLQLVKTGDAAYSFADSFIDEMTSSVRSIISQIKTCGQKYDNLIDKANSPTAVKGSVNALDLSASIKTIGDGSLGEQLAEYIAYPVLKVSKSIKEIKDAYRECHSKKSTSDDATSSNTCYSTDDAISEYRETEETDEYLYCDRHNSHANDVMELDGELYTVSEIARDIYKGTLSNKLKNYMNDIQGYVNLSDTLLRY